MEDMSLRGKRFPADFSRPGAGALVHFASVFVLFGSALFWSYADSGFVRARARHRQFCCAWRRSSRPFRASPGSPRSSPIWRAGFDKAVDPETLKLFFYQTQFGPVAAIRLILLAAAVVLAALPGAVERGFRRRSHIGALLLIDQAWLGHAAEGGAGMWGALMLSVYCVHVLAGAAWLGGLPPLLFALREARGRGDDATRRQTLDLLARFSVVALPAVGLIVASGIGNVGFRVGSSVGRAVHGRLRLCSQRQGGAGRRDAGAGLV